MGNGKKLLSELSLKFQRIHRGTRVDLNSLHLSAIEQHATKDEDWASLKFF